MSAALSEAASAASAIADLTWNAEELMGDPIASSAVLCAIQKLAIDIHDGLDALGRQRGAAPIGFLDPLRAELDAQLANLRKGRPSRD